MLDKSKFKYKFFLFAFLLLIVLSQNIIYSMEQFQEGSDETANKETFLSGVKKMIGAADQIVEENKDSFRAKLKEALDNSQRIFPNVSEEKKTKFLDAVIRLMGTASEQWSYFFDNMADFLRPYQKWAKEERVRIIELEREKEIGRKALEMKERREVQTADEYRRELERLEQQRAEQQRLRVEAERRAAEEKEVKEREHQATLDRAVRDADEAKRKELEEQQLRHQEELRRTKETADADLRAALDELRKKYRDATAQQTREHETQVATLTAGHQTDLERARTTATDTGKRQAEDKYKRALDELVQAHKVELEKLGIRHKATVEDLIQKHQAALAQVEQKAKEVVGRTQKDLEAFKAQVGTLVKQLSDMQAQREVAHLNRAILIQSIWKTTNLFIDYSERQTRGEKLPQGDLTSEILRLQTEKREKAEGLQRLDESINRLDQEIERLRKDFKKLLGIDFDLLGIPKFESAELVAPPPPPELVVSPRPEVKEIGTQTKELPLFELMPPPPIEEEPGPEVQPVTFVELQQQVERVVREQVETQMQAAATRKIGRPLLLLAKKVAKGDDYDSTAKEYLNEIAKFFGATFNEAKGELTFNTKPKITCKTKNNKLFPEMFINILDTIYSLGIMLSPTVKVKKGAFAAVQLYLILKTIGDKVGQLQQQKVLQTKWQQILQDNRTVIHFQDEQTPRNISWGDLVAERVQ